MPEHNVYMWDDLENRIRPELATGERLLWAGRPRSGIIYRSFDALMIPFSVMWGGFAIFWEITAIRGGAPLFFTLFGIPFVLIGLYIMFGRFWIDSWQRAKTVYGVTNERVVIISGLFNQSIKSINLDTLTDLSLTEKKNGTGTITLGPTNPWSMWYGHASWPGLDQYLTPALDSIENARDIYEMIRNAQRDARVNISPGK
jgi:hypothetical protein